MVVPASRPSIGKVISYCVNSVGRLFWKFFLFVWLAQLAGILGVGLVFWLEHRRADQMVESGRAMSLPEPPPHFDALRRLPPDFGRGPPQGDHPAPPPGEFRIPFVPALATLLASLACAFALAWYFAKPIRILREAFDAAAEGDLDVRIGQRMGGRDDELVDLARDFDHMTERLRVLMEGQKNLLHDVSHEIRSPLARLQAAIGLARQQPSRMGDSLDRIEREGERINQQVGELLTLSRLEAGVVGAFENVDMGELLVGIVEDARFEGVVRGVEIDFVAGEMVEVRANAELLHRAIENIVRNALRFSPEGGKVVVKAGREGGIFAFSITDQGPGVPEADLEAIFAPFFREGGQVSGGGYGLGLAIAKRVLVAINGSIVASNGEAGGLVVKVILRV